MKPHKHAKIIKAWADGAEIETYNDMVNDWTYIPTPTWYKNREYRIKPEVKWEPKGKLPKGYLIDEKMHVAIPKTVHNYDMLCQFVQEHETYLGGKYCEVFKDSYGDYVVHLCNNETPSLGAIRMSWGCAQKLSDMLNNGEIEL